MTEDDKALLKVFHYAVEYQLYGLARYYIGRMADADLKHRSTELLNYMEAV